MARPRSWTDEQLRYAISCNVTWKETAKYLGVKTGSVILRRAADELELDYSHFLGVGGGRHTPRIEDADLFTLNSPISRGAVRDRFLKYVEFKCAICGIVEWQGKSAPLQVDHINGNSSDNRLENLRLLCANCHAQTDTWGGANRPEKGVAVA